MVIVLFTLFVINLNPERVFIICFFTFSSTECNGLLLCITGFPILGVEWQKMENPDLRVAMGMKADQKGVRIRRVDPTAPESEVLKPSDIILSFDGVDIANDGTGKCIFHIFLGSHHKCFDTHFHMLLLCDK